MYFTGDGRGVKGMERDEGYSCLLDKIEMVDVRAYCL